LAFVLRRSPIPFSVLTAQKAVTGSVHVKRMRRRSRERFSVRRTRKGRRDSRNRTVPVKNAADVISDAMLVGDLSAVLTGVTEWNAVSVRSRTVSEAAKIVFPDGKSVLIVPGGLQTGFRIGTRADGEVENGKTGVIPDVLNGMNLGVRNAAKRRTGLGV